MLHYNILYLDEEYLIKLDNVFKTSSNLFRLMSELIPFLCLKLYLLNFTIAHAQKRLLCLSEFVILVLY